MEPEETVLPFEKTSESTYPIQLVSIGNLPHIPTSLVRVTTCGELRLKVLQKVVRTEPPQGRFQIVSLQQRPKGSTTALNLLKVFASFPGHYVSKDWLTELFRRNRGDEEEDGWGALVRVDNIVSLLRGLLCPQGIEGEETLHKALVAYVKNHVDRERQEQNACREKRCTGCALLHQESVFLTHTSECASGVSLVVPSLLSGTHHENVGKAQATLLQMGAQKK